MLRRTTASDYDTWLRLVSWLLLASFCYALPWTAQAANPETSSTVLRIEGSNTLGAELIPALVKGLLKERGFNQVRLEVAAVANEQSLLASDRAGNSVRISIAAHGSSTGFVALAAGKADLAASSRPIKASEIRALHSLGNMTSAAAEHIIGLDGLAIIVHPDNPLTALSNEQLTKVFAGQISNWAQLGGSAIHINGPIHVYARDEQSGTYDSFHELLLKPRGAQLSSQAKRFEDSSALSDAVSQDRQAIGFIGLPYLRNSKALAIRGEGALKMLPSQSLIATEDYPLARRLYLYSPAHSDNPWLQALLQFAQSPQGQMIVKQAGFVGQYVQAMPVTVQAAMPEPYRRLAKEALRLSVNFRFQEGSASLDNKAQQDLRRLLDYLQGQQTPSNKVLLVGFADTKADPQRADLLSRLRALAVRRELNRAGVQVHEVLGMGAQLPVASNEDDEGRIKNRRVEVWVYP